MEAKESRTGSSVVVAFALAFLIGIIVTMTAGTAAAQPADAGLGIHLGIAR